MSSAAWQLFSLARSNNMNFNGTNSANRRKQVRKLDMVLSDNTYILDGVPQLLDGIANTAYVSRTIIKQRHLLCSMHWLQNSPRRLWPHSGGAATKALGLAVDARSSLHFNTLQQNSRWLTSTHIPLAHFLLQVSTDEHFNYMFVSPSPVKLKLTELRIRPCCPLPYKLVPGFIEQGCGSLRYHGRSTPL